MTQMRMSVLKIASVVLFIPVALFSGWGQDSIIRSTDSTLTPSPGAGHDYIHMLDETVNPVNGQVSVRIHPPLPVGRQLGLPFFFRYDSSAVHIMRQGGYSNPFELARSGNGWDLPFPSLGYEDTYEVHIDNDGNPVQCPILTNYTFVDSEGGHHNFGSNMTVFHDGDPAICGAQGGPASGGDDAYGIVTSIGGRTATVFDLDGTAYVINGSDAGLVTSIEDRNGNTIRVMGYVGGITDTLGRNSVSLSSWGSNGTITIGGLAYNVTWGTTTANLALHSWDWAGSNEAWIQEPPQTFSVITAIQLPNNTQYTFHYNPVNGLLDKITYPDGGWVQYIWGTDEQAEQSSATHCQAIDGNPNYCSFATRRHSWPAIIHRAVSFDGSSVALAQDYSYSTNWVTDQFQNTHSTTKQSIVTTTDNVTGQVTRTILDYGMVYINYGPNPGVYPEETTRTEQVFQNGNWNTVRTINKTWQNGDPELLGSEQTTLWPSGASSLVTYNWIGTNVLKEKDEYGFGQVPPSIPARRTIFNYDGSPIADKPCQVIIYDNNGNRAGETDYLYDNATTGCAGTPSVTPVNGLPAGTHDEAKYGASSITPRGNLTTQVHKCFLPSTGASCQDAVINYSYDETGQVVSKTDANQHTTAYSYADNFTEGGPAPGNTNAYLTTVTYPTTSANGMSHVEHYGYAFQDGQLTSSTDQNQQTTTYAYNDSLRRLRSVTGPPDPSNGNQQAQTVYNYNDGSSPYTSTMEVQQTIDSRHSSSLTLFDGLGRTVRTETLNDDGDPAGVYDQVDTCFDGQGEKYFTSFPYRSSGFTAPYACSNSQKPGDTFAYDALGRLTTITHTDGNTVSTDYSQFPSVTVTDETGKQRRNRSDALGHLLEVDEPGVGIAAGNYAIMQTDGNFVVYNSSGSPRWYSGTNSSNYSDLRIQNDGNLVLNQYPPVWYTGTSQSGGGGNLAPANFCYSQGTTLGSDQELQPEQCLVSPSNRFVLVMQDAGNLVLYDLSQNAATALWYTPTSVAGSYAIVQWDGNFVVYDPSGNPQWNAGSNQSGSVISNLVMQDDGNLVLYQSRPLWNSNTSQSGGGGSLSPVTCTSLGTTLGANQEIQAGSCLVSSNQRFELTMQSDGNLVLYDLAQNPVTLLWNAGTSLSPLDPSVALVTLYNYDALGNLIHVEQHGHSSDQGQWRQRNFGYDSLSQLLTAINPESGTINYSYDAIGNLITKESPLANQPHSVVTSRCNYEYDELNRLTSRYCDHEPVEYYDYDLSSANGTSVNNPIGRLVMTSHGPISNPTLKTPETISSYDFMGHTEFEIQYLATRTNSLLSKKFIYAYNLDGSLKTITYPSGRLVTYNYNRAQRPVSAIDNNGINFGNNTHYTPWGALSSMVSGGMTTNDYYNLRMQPCRLATSSTGVVSSTNPCTDSKNLGNVMDLGYDFNSCNSNGGNNGNVCRLLNNKTTSRTQNFAYDLLNRLTSATSTGWNQSFGYDSWGNLLAKNATGGDTSLNVSVNGNNQVTIWCYDAAGNVSGPNPCSNYSSGAFPNLYDKQNRLSETTTAAGATLYGYDADGRRVSKSNAGGSLGTLYWYGPSDEVLEETDLNGNLQNEYVFFGEKRIARYSATNGYSFYFSDHLGSADVVTDVQGNIKEESDYYPFGGERIVTDLGIDNRYKFTGKERDPETGCDYFGARYYCNPIGRFITPDWAGKPTDVPYANFGNPQSLNLYSYVQNNPTTFGDPDGHANLWGLLQIIDRTASGAANKIRKSLDEALASEARGLYQQFSRASLDQQEAQKLGLEMGVTVMMGTVTPDGGEFSDGEAATEEETAVTETTMTETPVTETKASEKTYQTYTKTNPENGEVYSGRTSGTGTAEANVRARDANHHMSEKGFGSAKLDKSSSNANAIRGREQILIKRNGGAKSEGGTSGNAYNGVGPKNKKAKIYEQTAQHEFGND